MRDRATILGVSDDRVELENKTEPCFSFSFYPVPGTHAVERVCGFRRSGQTRQMIKENYEQSLKIIDQISFFFSFSDRRYAAFPSVNRHHTCHFFSPPASFLRPGPQVRLLTLALLCTVIGIAAHSAALPSVAPPETGSAPPRPGHQPQPSTAARCARHKAEGHAPGL